MRDVLDVLRLHRTPRHPDNPTCHIHMLHSHVTIRARELHSLKVRPAPGFRSRRRTFSAMRAYAIVLEDAIVNTVMMPRTIE
jgi:hypothetical protein